MQIFSRVVSWIAFVVLVIVSFDFFLTYPRGSWDNPSAIQIIQIWTQYLGVVIPVYCMARLIQLGCAPIQKRNEKEETRPATSKKEVDSDLLNTVRERNQKAYQEAMQKYGAAAEDEREEGEGKKWYD